MLLFARHGTSVAPDTSILVDDESIAHKKLYIVSAARDSLRHGSEKRTTVYQRLASSNSPGESRAGLAGQTIGLFSGHVEFNAAIAGAALLCIVGRDGAGSSNSLRCHAFGADTLTHKSRLNRFRTRQ